VAQEDINIHVHVHLPPGVDYTPRFDALEAKLVTLTDDLAALKTDFDGYKADVAAKLDQLAAQITDLQTQIANGDPAAAQTVADIKADLDAARAELGDADGDGTPAPVEPTP
jgi:multidrug resistance efflux pump